MSSTQPGARPGARPEDRVVRDPRVVETPNEARQATKTGSNRTVLMVSIVLLVIALAIALWYFTSQPTGDVVEGVVVNPDPAPVTQQGGGDAGAPAGNVAPAP